jgi:dipeptidyl aminopeptidase/acylaminoacyl peptidase
MPGAGVASDVTKGEPAQLIPTEDGAAIDVLAPIDGSYELWRISTDDGAARRLTTGRHHLSSFDAVPRGKRTRYVYLRSTPTEPPELWLRDADARVHQLTRFNAELLDDLTLVEPVERRSEVDGRSIQGWFMPGGGKRGPLVTQIHGGPHSLYGWSPFWEFQLLAAEGIGVFYCNPRGSQGYGQDFNDGNHRDWGPGPMRDVLAGVDALVADGLADPKRLGLTGGSYGGYLTNWIIGHDDRFRAAMTCRSVSDMSMLFLTGDISGGDWATLEFDATPWSDPAYFREISPVSYAERIRTPLLIQHAERDIRTTVGQAEALFTVLRSLRRPVRLLRVPEETHELTRSGTPFRRIENLRIVLDWFRHYLVDGKRGMPPLPKVHGGR